MEGTRGSLLTVVYTSRRRGKRAMGTGLTQLETLLTFLVDITGLILEQLAQSLDVVLFGG